jgi:YVTN family beta-propeller protein
MTVDISGGAQTSTTSDSDASETADGSDRDDELGEPAGDGPALADEEPVSQIPSSGATEEAERPKPRRDSLPAANEQPQGLDGGHVAAPPSTVTDPAPTSSSSVEAAEIQRSFGVTPNAPEPTSAAAEPTVSTMSFPAASVVQTQRFPAIEAPAPPTQLKAVANALALVGFGPLLGTGSTDPVGSPLGLAALAWGTRPRFQELLSGNPSPDTPRLNLTSQTVELAALSQAAPAIPELTNQADVTVQNNPAGVVIARNQAYVVNQGSNTVSVINTTTNAVTGTINVGTSPTAVTATPDVRYVYVANSGSGNVTVIDTATNTVRATIKVGSSPQDVAVNPAGTRAYLANFGSGTVSVINTSSNKVVGTISVGSGPTAVTVNPNGRYVYVARNNGTVAVVDTAWFNSVTKTIQVGSSPRDMVADPATGKLFVANFGSNSVSVINLADHTATGTIGVGSSPTSLALSPDGGVLYVAHNTDTVTRIDTRTDSVLGSTSIDTAPDVGAHSVAVRADGRRVYVTDPVERIVSVLAVNYAPVAEAVAVDEPNPDTGVVTGSFTVTDADGDPLSHTVTQPANGQVVVVGPAGQAGTYTFTYTPDPTARGQVSTDSFTVVLSDGVASTSVGVTVPVLAAASSDFEVTPIAVGANPIDVTVGGNRLYVLNSGDGSVSVIDTVTSQVVNTIPGLGYSSPMVASADGRYLYMSQYDGYFVTASVKVVDTATGNVVTTVTMPKCEMECWANSAGITDIEISPDGSRVYVSELWVGDSFYAGTITMIDTATNTVVASTSNSQYGDFYSNIEVTPDGTRLYAGSGYPYFPQMDVLDARTLAPIGTVPLDGNPGWPPLSMGSLTFSPNGERAYARTTEIWPTYSSQTFAVIDTDPASATYNTQIATITVPAGAQYMVVSPDGRAYVVHEGGKFVTVIDTATNTVIGSINSDQVGGDYAALAVGPDGTLYFTNYADNAVYAVTVGDLTML